MNNPKSTTAFAFYRITLNITQQFPFDITHILPHTLKPYTDLQFFSDLKIIYSPEIHGPLFLEASFKNETNSIYMTKKSQVLTINLLIGDLIQFNSGARFT